MSKSNSESAATESVANKDSQPHLNYRPDIDGLRALAIIPVLIFHAFPSLMQGGFIGVDIFFVISGFLISSIILRNLDAGTFSFTDFYSRRVRRIFPALITILLFVLIFGWFALLADEYKLLGQHVAASAAFVQNFMLWQEAGYFDVSSDLKPLLHVWSLAIEEQFYLIFPLLLWAAWRLGVNLLVLVVVLALGSLALNLHGMDGDPTPLFYSPLTRFWELMAGAILAYLTINYQASAEPSLDKAGDLSSRQLLQSAASCLGLVLVVGSAFAFSKADIYPGWRAVYPVMGTVLLIYAGPNAFVNRAVLSNKLAIFVGLISYPLYLWHWPLLSFARIIEADTPAVWLRGAIVLLSIVLAILTYFLIEQPIRRGKYRKFWAITLVAIMFFVAGWGLLVNARDGTSRLDGGVLEVKVWNEGLKTIEDNCAKDFPTWNNRDDFFKCYFLHDRKPDITVIGDSHAVRLYYGIAYHLGEDHNPALFPLGCAMPFYDISVGIPEYYRKGNYHLFNTGLINSALDYSKDDPDVKLIVLTTGACWRDIVDTTDPDITNFGEIVERKMRLTFERLSEVNKPVIYVLDNPTLDYHPKRCIQRPFRFSATEHPCKMNIEAYDNQRKVYFEVARRVLADYPNIIAFDSASYLCDEEFCYSNLDNKMLYHDPSHLSTDGSKYIGDFLSGLITETLRN
ncbi:MAG: acyltransferase family protein [Pseudomonadota bacterium]